MCMWVPALFTFASGQMTRRDDLRFTLLGLAPDSLTKTVLSPELGASACLCIRGGVLRLWANRIAQSDVCVGLLESMTPRGNPERICLVLRIVLFCELVCPACLSSCSLLPHHAEVCRAGTREAMT